MRHIHIKFFNFLYVLFSLAFVPNKIDKETFIPSTEELIQSLTSYHKRVFIYLELKQKQERKGALLKLLPLLGIDFFNPQISLKFNTSKYTNSLAHSFEKEDFFSLSLAFQSSICELIKLRDILVEEIELYNSHVDLFLCIKEQIVLADNKYANCTITPTEYLSMKEKFLQKQLSLHEHYVKLETLQKNLICYAKVNSHIHQTPK